MYTYSLYFSTALQYDRVNPLYDKDSTLEVIDHKILMSWFIMEKTVEGKV